MSHLIHFLENARKALSPAEWAFFNARFIDGKGVAESAALSGNGVAGDGEEMRLSVLRKLRGDPVEAEA